MISSDTVAEVRYPPVAAAVPDPYRTVVDVMLILVDGSRILLALREGTGYADGLWNLPSGKLEAGEDVVAAVIREAREEVGLPSAGTRCGWLSRCTTASLAARPGSASSSRSPATRAATTASTHTPTAGPTPATPWSPDGLRTSADDH